MRRVGLLGFWRTVIASMLFWWGGALAVQHAPAGYVIQNQAAASVSGEQYLSNVVETKVLPLCAPSMVPNGTPANPAQRQTIGIGGEALLVYSLSNAGNKDFLFKLSTAVSGDSSWVPASTAFFLDQNQNGTLDPGEERLTSISLQPEESVQVLLQVEAPNDARGSLFITPVATCPDGEADDDNYAEVVVRSGPALSVEKRFTPTSVKPGDSVLVTLVVRNLGDQPANDEVFLIDDFEDLPYLAFVSGSASAAKGVVEYYDGSDWTPSEPGNVKGVRLRLSNLVEGEEAVLRFSMVVASDAPPANIENAARAEGPGGPSEVRASLSVLPVYGLHLGPKNRPRAVGDEDRQEKMAFVGQETCFEHTLLNAANVEDQFDLEVTGLPDGVSSRVLTLNDVPLSFPVVLEPGQSLDFKFCLTVSDAAVDPFEAALVARSRGSGKEDPTYDAVTRILPADALELEKSVQPEGTVSAGTILTYTLRVKNGYDVDLHHVQIRDVLDAALIYQSSLPEGTYLEAEHTVVWELDRLSPGEVWEATLTVQVKRDTPDDTLVDNSFAVTSDEITNPLVSPVVENRIWSTGIQISKSVAEQQVRIGDRVHYRIRLYNPGSVSVVVDLTDRPDPRLQYISGTASPFEPELKDGALIWKGVTLGPGEEAEFTYEMRVTASAQGELINIATAQGTSVNGSAVSTGEVRALVEVRDPLFVERKATIVGRVFLDFNRNGRYEEATDRPLPGARVVLSNGHQVVTDVEGRFAFRDVRAGVWLIKLDAASAPFAPLPHPESMGDGYVHRINAHGLTTTDFPLAAPKGWIRDYRSTRLVMGPLVLEKELIPLGRERYRVVIHLSTSQPLPDFQLRDPLPGGGEKVFRFDQLVGEKTIVYELEAPAWLTDPEVRWRYP